MQGGSVIVHDVGGKQQKAELDRSAVAALSEGPASSDKHAEVTPAVPHSLTPAVERLLKVAICNSSYMLQICAGCSSWAAATSAGLLHTVMECEARATTSPRLFCLHDCCVHVFALLAQLMFKACVAGRVS